MKQTGASYQDTAIRFNMNQPSLIATWNSKFLKEGVEGLTNVKGRPSMPKKTKDTPTKVEKAMSPIVACINKLLHWIYALLNRKETFQDIA